LAARLQRRLATALAILDDANRVSLRRIISLLQIYPVTFMKSKESFTPAHLDKADLRILELLADNGRISWREMSERIGLSLTPTLRRIRRLEGEGIVTGYTARYDEQKLGVGICVLVSVTLERQTEDTLKVFEERIARVPEVMSCMLITGGADYQLRVVTKDLSTYQRFLAFTLTRIPGVAHVQSSFAIKSVVQRTTPPMDIVRYAR
jgi:DNA-binding Lrp family transcriptional regulator